MAGQGGDQCRAGDVIAEIETDKATMEVEAADDGRLGKILVPEGTENVKVNRPSRCSWPTARGRDRGLRAASEASRTAAAEEPPPAAG